ncbi:MAG: Gfo/Idh/MocA family oxidoreductase, partial [Pseudorhodoplanes sp.]
LSRDPRIQMTAAADPRSEARRQFQNDFGGSVYRDVEELCRDTHVDAIYIASPHQFHVDHVVLAARNRKHILVEKPLALTLADCEKMIEACESAFVYLIVGHSHSFDTPYLKARELIASGEFGRVRMINCLNFTDYMYRPRRPEELDTKQGGGAIFSQAPHQLEVVRILAGGEVASVRAKTGVWDESRRTEGAYSAFLTFDNGAFASLSYSGYGHFDSDELCGWIGETGSKKDPAAYGAARRALARITTPEAEAELKSRRAYGTTEGAEITPSASDLMSHNHFGFVVVSCDRADIRPLPDTIMIYGDETVRHIPLTPPSVPRSEVIDELYRAVFLNIPPLHSGKWGMKTLEVCLAILKSSREDREIKMIN